MRYPFLQFRGITGLAGLLCALLLFGWQDGFQPMRQLGEQHNRQLACLSAELHQTQDDQSWAQTMALQQKPELSLVQWESYATHLMPLSVFKSTDRETTYHMLQLSNEAMLLSEVLFSEAFMLDNLPTWQSRVKAARLSVREQWLLLQAADIMLASDRFWQENENLLNLFPADTSRKAKRMHRKAQADASQQDSIPDEKAYRKLRRRRITKADAYGLFKGIIAGAWWFGGDNIIWDVPDRTATTGAVAAVLVIPAIESALYVRKINRNPATVFDDPWWGPDLPKPTF